MVLSKATPPRRLISACFRTALQTKITNTRGIKLCFNLAGQPSWQLSQQNINLFFCCFMEGTIRSFQQSLHAREEASSDSRCCPAREETSSESRWRTAGEEASSDSRCRPAPSDGLGVSSCTSCSPSTHRAHFRLRFLSLPLSPQGHIPEYVADKNV